MSRISCVLGIIFVLAIAALHISGLPHYSEQINQSNASDFLKSMFPVLYAIPSLYLAVLAIFGFVALSTPTAFRRICFVLAVAVFAAGLLALLLGEWIPVVVMGGGAALFVISALTQQNQEL